MFAGQFAGPGSWYDSLLTLGLLGSVLAAVHHAEVVAHRVGEPYGTLVLAIAITVIEVGLIVTLMLAGGPATAALARDTVFAAVMIIVNGMLGICLLVGASRHRVQTFGIDGVSAALATLAAIVVLTLVLPNYTTTVAGPVYSKGQLAFVAIVSLVLYGTFVLVQAVRHRDYFLPPAGEADADAHAPPPPTWVFLLSLGLMLACLGAVVLLGKSLAPTIELIVEKAGAPPALVGVIIAAVVLLPEGLAALRAAQCQPPANQPEPGTGLGAGQHRIDDSGGGHRLLCHRLDADSGHRPQVDGAADAIAAGGDLFAQHRADHRVAWRGPSRDLRGLPAPDDRAVIRPGRAGARRCP